MPEHARDRADSASEGHDGAVGLPDGSAERAVSGELLPVPSGEARPAERPEAALTAPVAAATGGLLAGFVTIALVRFLRGGRRSRGAVRLGGRRGKAIEIAGSRSFLVDVHVLKR